MSPGITYLLERIYLDGQLHDDRKDTTRATDALQQLVTRYYDVVFGVDYLG